MAVCFPEVERKPQGSQAMRLEVSHHPSCLHHPRLELSVCISESAAAVETGLPPLNLQPPQHVLQHLRKERLEPASV